LTEEERFEILTLSFIERLAAAALAVCRLVPGRGRVPGLMNSGANPLAAINSVALAIGRFATLVEMLDYALAKVLEVVQAEAGGVYLLDEGKQELNLVVHRGLSERITRDLDGLKLGEGLSGKVMLTGEPIIIRSLHDDPRVTRRIASAEGFRGFAAVPLRSNFKTYGTLNIHSRVERLFSEEEVQLLTSMASQIGLAVANARLYLDLQASERRFRGLVENAEDLIYLASGEGRLMYANPALERLLGYEPAGLCASGVTVLSLVHPEDRPKLERLLPQMLGGQVLRSVEFRMMHADGRRFCWFSQTNVPLRDESGAPAGMQCTAHDITDRRTMQEQMARAEQLARLGRMAANIAHEIRNPLGAIVNSVNMLRHQQGDRDQRLLEIVSEEADRLNAIITEFLMFARPPARVPVPCDIAELLESTVLLFRRGGKSRHDVDVTIACAPGLPLVPADPNQMRQVLWNLLVNAVEATAVPRRVLVDAQVADAGRTVTIAVTDNGPGVQDAEAVFEPFFTTKPEGTGLGLAVVARIVRDHGGFVKVENVPGHGARFTVGLPVAPAPGDDRSTWMTARATMHTQGHGYWAAETGVRPS
jgi:PAS domain S-box-containing protein